MCDRCILDWSSLKLPSWRPALGVPTPVARGDACLLLPLAQQEPGPHGERPSTGVVCAPDGNRVSGLRPRPSGPRGRRPGGRSPPCQETRGPEPGGRRLGTEDAVRYRGRMEGVSTHHAGGGGRPEAGDRILVTGDTGPERSRALYPRR